MFIVYILLQWTKELRAQPVDYVGPDKYILLGQTWANLQIEQAQIGQNQLIIMDLSWAKPADNVGPNMGWTTRACSPNCGDPKYSWCDPQLRTFNQSMFISQDSIVVHGYVLFFLKIKVAKENSKIINQSINLSDCCRWWHRTRFWDRVGQ